MTKSMNLSNIIKRKSTQLIGISTWLMLWIFLSQSHKCWIVKSYFRIRNQKYRFNYIILFCMFRLILKSSHFQQKIGSILLILIEQDFLIIDIFLTRNLLCFLSSHDYLMHRNGGGKGRNVGEIGFRDWLCHSLLECCVLWLSALVFHVSFKDRGLGLTVCGRLSS